MMMVLLVFNVSNQPQLTSVVTLFAVVTSRHARGLDPVLSIVSVNIKSEIICARRRRHERTLLGINYRTVRADRAANAIAEMEKRGPEETGLQFYSSN